MQSASPRSPEPDPSRSRVAAASAPAKVLLVAPNVQAFRLVSALIQSQAANEYVFGRARCAREAAKRLGEEAFDIVAVEQAAGKADGETIAYLQARFPEPRYILVAPDRTDATMKPETGCGYAFVPKSSNCGFLFDRTAQEALRGKRLAQALDRARRGRSHPPSKKEGEGDESEKGDLGALRQILARALASQERDPVRLRQALLDAHRIAIQALEKREGES